MKVISPPCRCRKTEKCFRTPATPPARQDKILLRQSTCGCLCSLPEFSQLAVRCGIVSGAGEQSPDAKSSIQDAIRYNALRILVCVSVTVESGVVVRGLYRRPPTELYLDVASSLLCTAVGTIKIIEVTTAVAYISEPPTTRDRTVYPHVSGAA